MNLLIKDLKWILEDDKFGFGVNWKKDSQPQDDYEQAGKIIQTAIDYLESQEPEYTPVLHIWKKDEVKPCPFCNDIFPLNVVKEKCDCGKHDWLYIECERCGARGPSALPVTDKTERENQDEALKLWNAREAAGS